jgi:hypothetical protein
MNAKTVFSNEQLNLVAQKVRDALLSEIGSSGVNGSEADIEFMCEIVLVNLLAHNQVVRAKLSPLISPEGLISTAAATLAVRIMHVQDKLAEAAEHQVTQMLAQHKAQRKVDELKQGLK